MVEAEELIEIDPRFHKFIDVFSGKIPESELSDGEKAAYSLFWAGAIFMQQLQITQAVYKLDIKEGLKMYNKLFREEKEEED